MQIVSIHSRTSMQIVSIHLFVPHKHQAANGGSLCLLVNHPNPVYQQLHLSK